MSRLTYGQRTDHAQASYSGRMWRCGQAEIRVLEVRVLEVRVLEVRVLEVRVLGEWIMLAGAAAGAATPLAPACENALAPVREGWAWTYRVTPGDRKEAVSNYVVSRAALGEGFQEKAVNGGKTVATSTYKCTQGAHMNLTPPPLGKITLTRAAVTGSGLIADTAWKPGARWALTWDLEGRQGVLSGKATFTANRQVVGREKVTVPAGTFDAWKVRVGYTVTGKLGPVPLNRDLGDFDEWYAEGVGLVKSLSSYNLTELMTLKK